MELPVEIFCCYASQDQYLLEELEKHLSPLQRQGVIVTWNNLDINPGTNAEEEHSKYFNSAHIILLLVSPDFLASDYCYGQEIVRAIERHQQGKAVVIPIILRPIYWEEAPFADLQALPTAARPVVTWLHRDEAWLDITRGIKRAVEDLARKPPTLLQQESLRTSRQDERGEVVAEKTPLPEPSSPDLMAWCPSCMNQFYVGDCDIVSRVTPGKVLKAGPAPDEWKQLARRRVESLTSPKYLRELACRKCPYCAYLLPFNIELARNVSIAIIGDVNSGKTHYLTSVMYELKERWLPENRKSVSLTCLTPEVEELYYQQYYSPVFLWKQVLFPTPRAGDSHRDPLIYELKFKSPSGHALKRVNLLFYDGSGEEYTSQERMIEYARHVMYASAIIFLIDPLAFTEVVKKLREAKQLSEHFYANYPAASRGTSFVAKETLQLFERYHGLQAETLLRSLPVAITLSKADLFRYVASVAPKHGFLSHSLHRGQVDSQEIKAIDEEVRGLVAKNKGRSLLRLSQRFSTVSFFAASATGCAPDKNFTYPFIDPCRCLDPILWILDRLGVLHAHTN